MTGHEGATVEVSPDGSQRLVDEPQTFGDPSHQTPEPTPAEILNRPDVQQLLNGDPPKLVLDSDGFLRLADEQTVGFNRNDPNHSLQEFLRQGRLQENGLNRLTIGEIFANQDTYTTRDAQGLDPRRGGSAQSAYGARIGDTFDDIFPNGRDVLHGPDQRPGGDPLNFDGVGDSGVNRSLGSQWVERTGLLNDQIIAAREGLPFDLLDWVRPNVIIRITDLAG
jgi:hypothetical protein